MNEETVLVQTKPFDYKFIHGKMQKCNYTHGQPLLLV